MSSLEYLHLQMHLEGKGIVGNCFIRQVEVVPGEEVPLMLIAQPVDGAMIVYYDEFIRPDLQKELAAKIRNVEFPDVDALCCVLETHNISFEVGHYKTYIFPAMPAKDADVRCLSKEDPIVKAFGFDGLANDIYTIGCDNRIVSACVSTRENETCGEACVYTAPEYRHQGLAQKVVNTWAQSLMAAGKIPFYSYDIKNQASANLAGKLRLQPTFDEITIAQISRVNIH